MKNMNIAITGADGHYGSRLANTLVKQGYTVHCLVRSDDYINILPKSANIYTGDVRNEEIIESLLEGCDGVAHLAYGADGTGEEINIGSTKTIFKKAEKIGCNSFVFTSTLSAHRDVIGEDPHKYQATKNMAAEWLRKQKSDMNVLIVYPVYTIGPHDYKLKRSGDFLNVFSNRFLFPPLYDFEKKRYLHIDTGVEAIKKGVEGNINGECVLPGDELSKKRYYQLIAKHSPRSHMILPSFGARKWLPHTLNILGEVGIVPSYMDYTEIEWVDEYPLPDKLVHDNRISKRSVESAITDAIDWYQEAGVL